jgi:GT2 family glycosyltransferase
MSRFLCLLRNETRERPARAQAWLELATGAHAKTLELSLLRALCAQRTGDPCLAIARFLSANQAFPGRTVLLGGLARALDDIGLYEAALDQWLRLAADDPRLAEPLNRSLALIERLGLTDLPSAQRLYNAQLPHLRTRQIHALHRAIRALSNTPGVVGAVWLDGPALKGWVLDKVFPTRSIDISVSLNGHPIAGITAKERFPVGRAFCLALSAPTGDSGVIIDVLADGVTRLPGAPLRVGSAPPAWLARPPDDLSLRPGRGVDVVVPVYRDRTCVARCLESMLASRPLNQTNFRLVLVNDCSPESGMEPWLRARALDAKGIYLRTPRNLGFIGAINLAMDVCRNRDMVWLNSDTLVAGDWLDRLRAAAQSASNIASVTPLSNNAQLFSYPRAMRDNPMPDAAGTADLHRLAGMANGGDYPSVPTGVGFCLYLKAEALAAAGPLDDRAYMLGYAEEIDYCLRLSAAGWRHLCAADVYVAHQGGTSFQGDKTRLAKDNDLVIQQRYPLGRASLGAFQRGDPLVHARARMERLWLARNNRWDGLFLLSFGARRRYYVHDFLQRRQRAGARDLQLCSVLDQDGLLIRFEGVLDFPPFNLRFQLPRQQADLARELLALRIDERITVFHDRDFPPVLFDLAAGMPQSVEVICLDESLERNRSERARLPENHVLRGHSRYRLARWNRDQHRRSVPIQLNQEPETRRSTPTSRPGHAWVAVLGQSTRPVDQQCLLALVRLHQSHARWLVVGKVIDVPALLSTSRCECLSKPSIEDLLDHLSWIGCKCVLNLSHNPGPDPSAFLVSRRLSLPYIGFLRGDGVAYLKEPETLGLHVGTTVEEIFETVLSALGIRDR